MYGSGDFYESYYEHGCSIVHEKDVLDTDIKGNSCAKNYKRWWFNLFLLSYSDKRARVYYNSSHAIKVERTKHFRRHRNCIHPFSKFRNFWDCLILQVLLLNKVLFHHATSMSFAHFPVPVYVIGGVLEFLLIFDIYINSKCGYIDDTTRRIILDIQKSLFRYGSTKLFFHVTSAIPTLSILFLRFGWNIKCVPCKSNTFVCALCVVDAVKLLRIFEKSSYWTVERDTFRSTYFFRFLRICLLALMTTVQFISLSESFRILRVIHVGQIEKTSFFYLVMRNRYLGVIIWDYPLLVDFLRVVFTIVQYNFGFGIRTLIRDKVSCIIFFCIACTFYMWALLEILSCISRNRFTEDQIIHNKVAARNLAICRQLPDKISLKIRSYYDFDMTKPRVIETQNGFYKALPLILKKEIFMSSYTRKVMRIPYFSDWSLKMIESIIILLKEEIYLKQDVVAESGVQGNGLVIVDVGVMAVYTSDHVEIGHLIDGDYFGELSLVTDREIRMSYVIAVTNCKVLVLEKSGFRKFMRDYPKLFFELKRKLCYTYNLKDNVPNSTTT